jgi:hypothetical protein
MRPIMRLDSRRMIGLSDLGISLCLCHHNRRTSDSRYDRIDRFLNMLRKVASFLSLNVNFI